MGCRDGNFEKEGTCNDTVDIYIHSSIDTYMNKHYIYIYMDSTDMYRPSDRPTGFGPAFEEHSGVNGGFSMPGLGPPW